ncbi:hypothetical protein M2454_002930 [Aequitasia blattaphilus]|uniref:Uncharacterized protein n=1 Tax=Aequitasia blattaphilus TaxID=2949332 RepID=A0ABT1ECQ7_9FIRM|nr:hypothetical protein [Aequitasia blattaphilus]MCP1103605.1 hypothetical protein [Aequitasia blattaphilus]MCR8616245.1 hypothetical protein [Aequitasia blattaphilus]
MITYESLCKKLGFDILTYKVETSGTEDDSRENPFMALDIEELDFLGEYLQKHKAK